MLRLTRSVGIEIFDTVKDAMGRACEGSSEIISLVELFRMPTDLRNLFSGTGFTTAQSVSVS